MHRRNSNTNKIIGKFDQEKQKLFFSETWKEKVVLKYNEFRSNNTYFLVRIPRTLFYFQTF